MTENTEMLTEEQVNQVLNAWDFLEFSNSYRSSYYNRGLLTPDAVNAQMKNITMNPMEATLDGIEKALANPKSSEDILMSYSESLENQNMYYKRMLRYLPDMACFNLVFDPINAYTDEDMNSKEMKEDLQILDDFISRFDFKQEFQLVLRQMFRQGVYYGVLRSDGERYTLQELPPKFCKITGRFSHGLLFDYDMNWFFGNYGVDINMYPKVFKKMYRDVFEKITTQYKPSKPAEYRNTSFVYWHQTSPDDGFWCFKPSPEIATIIPYFSPLFPNISTAGVVRKLQVDKYFIEASKLLVGIIGFNKDAKSGQVQNQINMTPDVLGKFLGVARQGLSKQIGLVALPLDDIKAVQFDTSDTNIENDANRNVAEQGVASADVMLSNTKLNSHQSKLASAVDVNILYSLYPMFENFVEYFVNKKTKTYKFRIKFHDVDLPDYKNERMSRFKDFAQMGLVDIQQAARAVDMTAFELARSLSLTKTLGLKDKVMILLDEATSDNTKKAGGTGVGGKVGRPPNPMSDNDNTEASWDRGSNELKD